MIWLNSTRFRVIEDSAAQIRENFEKLLGYQIYPPIPVSTIAETLFGLTIDIPKRWRYSENTVAILNPDSKKIFLRSLPDPRPQRFGIAHELGHWILHASILQTPKLSVRVSRRLELEANLFAETILMPLSDLQQMCFKLDSDKVDREVFRILAKNCFVTDISLKIRLKNLYNYERWQGPWIDWSELDCATENNISIYQSRYMFIDKKIKATRLANQWISQRLNVIGITDDFAHSTKNTPLEKRAIRNKRVNPLSGGQLVKPLVIEFAGMPNSGKDTLIGDLEFWLSHQHGLTVKVINEAVKDRPYPREQIINRFRQSYHVTITNLLEAVAKPDVYDVVLLNRGLFDLAAWIKYYHKRGFMEHNEAEILTRMIYLEGYKEIEDLTIFFDIDPEISFQREISEDSRRADRLNKIGTIIEKLPEPRFVNPESLKVLHESYSQTYNQKTYDFRVKKVDANQNGFDDIFEKTLDICEPLIVNQIVQLELPF